MCEMKIFYLLAVFLTIICSSLCLYEDQIGKFDWRQTYVGKLKFAVLDSTSTVKKIIVASEQNVIAALNQKSGQILWRHVFERDETGEVNLLALEDGQVVTVSGRQVPLVRGWDTNGGYLLWEWTATVQNTPERLSEVMWFIHKKQLHQIILVPSSHIMVTAYDLTSGTQMSSRSIPVPWLSSIGKCVAVAPHLTCLESTEGGIFLNSLSLTEADSQLSSESLTTLLGRESPPASAGLDRVSGSMPLVAVTVGTTKQLLSFESGSPKVLPFVLSADAKLLTVPHGKQNILLQAVSKAEVLELSAAVLETGQPLSDLEGSLKMPASLGSATLAAAACSPRKDRGLGCRVLLSTEDHALVLLLHPGKLVWVREEALASIVAVEILDLPVSDTEQAIEQEFDHKETSFVGMFIHRITSQALQLRAAVLAILGFGERQSDSQRARLVRDEFGLHKIIVAVSSAGKVFGLDNLSGEVLWQQRLVGVGPFEGHTPVQMFVQRTARHAPLPAQCALLLRDKGSGEGVLFVFNPLTGQPVDGDNGYLRLGYRVRQTSLLHQADRDHLRGVLLLDEREMLHAYPDSCHTVAASVAHSTFLYTADPATGLLVGYSLAHSTPQSLVATRVWEVLLPPGTHQITAVVSKSPLERVHSQGRVLGDRSVLYKYVNPNLVAVVTQGGDPRRALSVFLLDVVSGAVVFSMTHPRAREPIHLVHSENWLVYSYVSDKSRISRRTELVALELYEGKEQSNTTAFSSITTPLQPIVDRQAYILPSNVEAMRETITEKGITSKHILVALSSGGVLELPWVFVDPRRPVTATPEMREEGVIPYMPELPIPSDAIINYNQSVERVRGIHTAPSGLESTCLVLTYGLDLFYTRVAPSKTFDVLKEDFDYFLITVVLVALSLASYVTRKLASKKALKQAWK